MDLYRSGEKKIAVASMVNLAVEDLLVNFAGKEEVCNQKLGDTARP